ncbi:Sedoheptulose 1,7-bisphosphatase [Exophiala xenobiotica]|nr:Sedoheptulose 1,7-bisphosphatase [Exophiala xenobiotica]KAK5203273.1 Sedoheptulose 1,7-bisphosphatase [Exophiala xenobiotica]KAK5263709.1 Sedoheptulose 1,7-bisphosphatase [Exophiala xenobiotica]KAK5313324.1 Sedoheptulose 1,7-bisphosphatase [Exophiala xenobiotica]KAK5332998.1 Sedoheptulose 1,7-bisphosphatase [Exophiala xenobiotica]
MTATAPRVFLIRHGETEWSRRELHTGSTDVPLTEKGEHQVKSTGVTCIGGGKLIDPARIARIYVSPRSRALQTVKLLDLGVNDRLPWDSSLSDTRLPASSRTNNASIEISEDLREWNYGDYEGKSVAEVWKKRQAKDLDTESRPWNIFQDGCEGGESPAQVTKRLDGFISKLMDDLRKSENGAGGLERSDIVCVAHGHILSALATRWTGRSLEDGMRLLIDTAGIAVLSFEHHAFDEPAIVIGPKS